MKAAMINSVPKICEKVAKKDCTILVKKTRPKIDVPFKCYLYCTKDAKTAFNNHNGNMFLSPKGWQEYSECNGKVIGEFVCDRIDKFSVFENGVVQYWNYHDLEKSCLTYDEVANYIGKNKEGYAWHISDLIIYDEPKEPIDFYSICKHKDDCFTCRHFDYFLDDYCVIEYNLKRPPQNWRYAEDKEIRYNE